MLRLAITSGHSAAFCSAVWLEKGLLFGPFRSDGRISGSLNLHTMPIDVAADRATELLRPLQAVMRVHGFAMPDVCVLSLPGVTTKTDLDGGAALIRAVGERCGWQEQPKYAVVDDTWSGLVAGLTTVSSKWKGICAFAGTGASVYVNVNDNYLPFRPYKRDGYGPLLGDFGSGFRLAMTTLEQLPRSVDTDLTADPNVDPGQKNELLNKVVETFLFPKSTERIVDTTHWFHELQLTYPYDWRAKVADLARLITALADQEDSPRCGVASYCRRLVFNAARDMAATITAAIKQFAHKLPPGDIHITCQGGMFRYKQYYLKAVQDVLRPAHERKLNITRAPYHHHVGTQILAAGSDLNRVPDSETIKLVCQLFENCRELFFQMV